jgi:signal transduction histidine kinase
MSLRANLGWVLAGTLVCGLCIAGYFSWSLTHLERMQYEVSSHSLTLRELHSISEQLDLLLVSSDLAIGSGETYTAQIAMSLSSDLVQGIERFGIDSSLPFDQRQIERFSRLLIELENQIRQFESYAGQGHDTDRADLLTRFDGTSGELVRTFEDMSVTAQAFATRKSTELAKKRIAFTTYHLLALILYFTANAVIVYWALRRIAWPLETLTCSVDEAMVTGSPLATSFDGPLEMSRLAKHFGRLVAQLEQRVTARTQELLDKTERLEQEVADRKTMQRALELAKERAEKSSRVKSEFLSVMSHELRTPMNAVLGSLSLFRDSGITAEQQKYVDIADESGKALVELLGEILDPDVPVSLVGDFTRLRQILINLVNNAIKFTDEGYVRINISNEPGKERPGLLRFSVTDTGIGVDDSDRTKIFETFTQADSSLSRDHSGVGLGLSICMKLARAMGGTCGMDGTRGQGSTFWFTVALPAPADAIASEDSAISALSDPSPVLIVENGDAFATAWLSEVLTAYRVPFTTVADSEVAMAELTAAKQAGNPYECIIINLQYSGFSEVSSVRQLASSVHELGGRIVALYSTQEHLTEEMVESPLFDSRHCGTVCQNELMKAVLADMEENVTSPPKNTCMPMNAGSNHRASTRILIVEDSLANRLIASAILKNAGFDVDGVGSGTDAIEKLGNTDFDVVLMDLQMSGMDGFEATRKIRNLKVPGSSTPIIAFSANVMEETRQQCREVGMNDFVSKPFVKETLLNKIAQWT